MPKPLEIIVQHGSTSPQVLAEEIQALSKLNWNTADFAGANPMTLAFAIRVGDIMKELPDEVIPLPEYIYYM